MNWNIFTRDETVAGAEAPSAQNNILLNKLLMLEEFLSEKFIALLRLTLAIIMSLGYFFSSSKANPFALNFAVLMVLGLQVVNSLVSSVQSMFSHTTIIITITVDGLSILGLFAVVALERSFTEAVHNEMLVYLQIIFIAFQALRLSKQYILYAASLLLFGRAAIYVYFRFYTGEVVSTEGSALSAVLRYLSLGALISVFLYIASRTRFVAKKAIDEYLEKNNLLVTNKELARAAHLDEKTGLYNNRYFQLQLAELVENSRIKKELISLVLVDLDNFKTVNDTLGHQAGDDALGLVADILKSVCSENDVLARYGGDEMVIIMPGRNKVQAMGLAEKMRREVEESFGKRNQPITLSIGVATRLPKKRLAPARLLVAADRAMYRAKKKGRNQVQTV